MSSVFLQPQARWASQKGLLNFCMQASNIFTMPVLGTVCLALSPQPE